jgi:phosphatidylglycerol:prolipoprotein diacylglycerol transferase
MGAAIGRFGCFLNGCCYGTPTNLPWGVRFPEGSLPFAQFDNAPLHPAQLYNVLAGLLTFVVVTAVAPRLRAPGQRWWLMLGLYALLRALVDTTRYYEPSAYVFQIGNGGLAESQLVGILIALWSTVLFFIMPRVAARGTAADTPDSTGAASQRHAG